MKKLHQFSVLIALMGGLAGTLAAQSPNDRVTVTDQGTYTLPASKTLTVRQLRSMKVNVIAGEGHQLQYTASITANKLGMERHFGDGKLKYTNLDGAAVLEYRPFAQNEQREQSWLKSLLTRDSRYEAVVDRAELTLTVPADVHLTIDSRYSDLSISGMKRALKTVGRYGTVVVKNHLGDLNISNLYGGVTVEKAEGNVDVESNSSTVQISGVSGRLSVSGRSMNLTVADITGAVSVQNRSGQNRIRSLAAGLRLESAYGSIHLSDIKGEAVVETRSASKFEAERVGALRVTSSLGTVNLTDVGANGGVVVSGSSLKIEARDLKGDFRSEGDRNSLELDRFTGLVDIRNANGSVTLSNGSGEVSVAGTNNKVQIDRHSGRVVDINQNRGAVSIQALVVPERYSVVTSTADVTLSLPTSFRGRYTLRNEGGQIEHNLGDAGIVRIDAQTSREETGGASDAGEIRIVNRNGSIAVKKQP